MTTNEQTQEAGLWSLFLDIRNLPTGAYICHIQAGEHQAISKFLVNH